MTVCRVDKKESKLEVCWRSVGDISGGTKTNFEATVKTLYDKRRGGGNKRGPGDVRGRICDFNKKLLTRFSCVSFEHAGFVGPQFPKKMFPNSFVFFRRDPSMTK